MNGNGTSFSLNSSFVPHYEAHKNYIQRIESTDCYYITHVEKDLLCKFITETPSCHELDGFFDYGRFIYCDLVTDGDADYLVLAFQFLLGLTIVYGLFLAVVAYVFFLPNILVIARFLKLNEHSAGIFIIMWANGLPDLLAVKGRHSTSMELLINQLMGTALFLKAFLSAFIYIMYPIHVHKSFFLRDSLFHILGTTSFAYLNRQERTIVYETIPTIFTILSYYIVAILQDRFLNNRLLMGKKNDIESSVINDRTKKIRYMLLRPLELKEYDGDNNKSSSFLQSINPLRKEMLKYSNKLQQVILVFGAPFTIILSLVIPVMNSRLPQRGWSKYRFCLNIALSPLVLLLVYELDYIQTLILFVFGCICGGFVFFLTSTDKPPRAHLFSVYGSLMCIWCSYRISSEILAVWTLIAIIKGFTREAVGIFFLTWGNSLQENIVNFSLASFGYPNMAFSAYFNTYFINVLLVVVLVVIAKSVAASSILVFLRKGQTGNSGIVFNFLFEFFFFFAVTATNFQLRRSVGKFAIMLYGIYLLHAFLVHIGVIHAYGTDHTAEDFDTKPPAVWA